MKRTINKIITAALAFLLICLTLSGCGEQQQPGEYEYPDREVYTFSFDIIGGRDVMPIPLYYGPYTPNSSINGNVLPDYTDEYYIRLISEAGINVFSYCPEQYPSARTSITKVLELAEKYKMGYYVNDYYITNMSHDIIDVDDVRIGERIELFSDYDSFIGFYSYDEPHYEYIEAIGKVNEAVNRLGEGRYSTYVNMLPVWEEHPIKYNTGTEVITYEDYIGKFIEVANARYISYDHYVYEFKSVSGYFNNMAYIRKVAQNNEMPFWAFIQTGGQFNDAAEEIVSVDYYPSEGQLIWNVNTSVAFGAKGIQYFLGFQPLHFAYAPNGTYDFNRNALFGAMGNVNQWYYYVQKVNRQLLAVDEILMNSYNAGVIATGAATEDLRGNDALIESGKFYQLQAVKGDALVGCFEYDKQTVLYVVNYSSDKANDISLSFDAKYDLDVIQRGEKNTVSGKNVKIRLEAGEGVLVKVNRP